MKKKLIGKNRTKLNDVQLTIYLQFARGRKECLKSLRSKQFLQQERKRCINLRKTVKMKIK